MLDVHDNAEGQSGLKLGRKGPFVPDLAQNMPRYESQRPLVMVAALEPPVLPSLYSISKICYDRTAGEHLDALVFVMLEISTRGGGLGHVCAAR